MLSFYGLSNGKRNLFVGQLAYSPAKDLAFRNYDRIKTFFTIIRLYRTKAIRHREFEMVFDHGVVKGETDQSGSFWCEVDMDERQTKLLAVVLLPSGEKVSLTEELYPNRIHSVLSNTIVVSDMDDTLIHSFISNKLKQIRTLLFTTVEKRKAVKTMATLIKRFSSAGAVPFYLSNSEQILYPILFRFLAINEFPPGPLFLKQYVRLRHMVMQKILRRKNIHKNTLLTKILEMFPDKQLVLIGDNTQHDLPIYLNIALKYPQNVRYIIIREVLTTPRSRILLQEAKSALSKHEIGFHYGREFPDDLPIDL